MKIIIETVPHEKNRNNQVGDYWKEKDGTLHVTVSEMGDDRYHLLVAIHEIWEMVTAEAHGIKEEDITLYDEYYERKRQMGLVPEDSENGFGNDCIYKWEHLKSTGIEMLLAAELGVDWNEYTQKVNSL